MDWLQVTPDQLEWFARLVMAAVLGAFIGLERDLHGRSAGLRTHALVSLGAAVFTLVSYVTSGALQMDGTVGMPHFDPGRIAAQVVTGIGFLGAGTIIKSQYSVRGLTTASCLWLVAGIGMACGVGLYGMAISTTLLALVFLVLVAQFERRLRREQYHVLTVSLRGREHLSELRDFLRQTDAMIRGMSVSEDFATGVVQARFSIRLREMAGSLDGGELLLTRLNELGLPLVRVEWNPVVD
jgi:putative Mg2+ transporter-C (MgtC) family protein